MKTGVFLYLVYCTVVSGLDLKPCFTRENVKGNCLFPFICSQFGSSPGKLASSSQDIRTCAPKLVCCPEDVTAPFIPQQATANIQFNTGQNFYPQNSRTERPKYLFPKPIIGNRQTLKDRSRTTVRPKSSTFSRPVWDKSGFSTGQKLRSNDGATALFPSSIDRNRKQIVFPNNCSVRSDILRIFGGVEASIGEFPWIALLEYGSGRGLKLRCSGSLISNWHVLTAAHCVNDWELQRLGLTLRSVRLGEWNTRTNPDCFEDSYTAPGQTPRCALKYVSVPIERVYIHPLFNIRSLSKQNDIALLQLKQPVQFNDYVRPVCLPITEEVAPWATVSGWGRTETALGSEKLLKADLPLVDKRKCEPFYRKKNIELGPTQLCYGEEGKDSCGGDSGGPLMQVDDTNVRQSMIYIIGIVSLGPLECGSAESSGVYTRVYDYVPWIHNQIRLMNKAEFESVAQLKSNQPLKFDESSKLIFPGN